MRLQVRTAGLPVGAAIGIKHERANRRGASLIRHFLQFGDTTYARPVRLSEIGMDTPDCTEVVSELQMEATHGDILCNAENHSIKYRVELLNQDFFCGYIEIYQQIVGLTKKGLGTFHSPFVIAFDLKMRPNYESHNINALVYCFTIEKESRLIFEEIHLMSLQFANG